jgi:hypothetical protein
MNDTDAKMQELFDRARSGGLWFRSAYQNLWFSPDELEQHNKDGRFRWSPVNWELRSPFERLGQLKKEAADAAEAVKAFEARIRS